MKRMHQSDPSGKKQKRPTGKDTSGWPYAPTEIFTGRASMQFSAALTSLAQELGLDVNLKPALHSDHKANVERLFRVNGTELRRRLDGASCDSSSTDELS